MPPNSGVLQAVEAELKELRKRDKALAESGLAALAKAAAASIDDPSASHTSRSMNHHQLRDTLVKLRELAPPPKVRDELDELRERHARRRTKAENRSQPKVRKKQGG